MNVLTRSASDVVYRPGIPVIITIHVVPDASVKAYAIEETPAVGWVITQTIGNFVGGIIKIGPFFDGNARDFQYQAKPPSNQTVDALFDGRISFDGVSNPITGMVKLKLDKIAPQSPK